MKRFINYFSNYIVNPFIANQSLDEKNIEEKMKNLDGELEYLQQFLKESKAIYIPKKGAIQKILHWYQWIHQQNIIARRMGGLFIFSCLIF